MKKLLGGIMAGLLMLCFSGMVSASALIYDRGLPTANLNNAAGSDRSNVAWGFNFDNDYRYIAGDDFVLEGSGDYLVDTIRVWTVTGTGTSLWFGEAGGDFTEYATATTVAAYSDATETTYQGYSGSYRSIYQLDVILDMILKGGTTYQFFLDGPVPTFIHASNAALSGSTQTGADDLYMWAAVDKLSNTLSSADMGYWTSEGNGWDKASDANIQVFGSAVPEPATFLLFGLGILGIAGASRKKTA